MSPLPSLDPITFAVVRNGLISAANEMYWVFKRTTMLPMLYEFNDFGMSIYDDELRLIAEAPGLPIFVGSLDGCIERTLDVIGGRGELVPGDILINNHPYLTAGQVADMAVIEPIFRRGELIGFCALRAHMGDLGAIGPYPTNSTDLFQEGLLVPGLKLYRAGELNGDLIRIIKANSRMPDETAGNVLAAAGALRAGSRAVTSLVDRYGSETYRATIEQLIEHGERVARLGISRIPDGIYEAEEFLDDDGVVRGEPVRLHCKVIVAGDEMTIDVSGSSPQTRGPVNCPWGYTLTTGRFVLKRLISADIPPNGGTNRPLRMIAPEGSVFNPAAPAPCYLSYLTSLVLSDVIVRTLAPALPDVIPADNGGDLIGFFALLRHPRTGKWCFFAEDAPVGHGAKRGADGMSVLIHPVSAGTECLPTELLETRFPVLRRYWEMRTDSGGAGEFRGGLAASVEYEIQTSGIAAVACDRARVSCPRGAAGGHDAEPNQVTLFPGTDREQQAGKESDIMLEPGDVVVIRPAGGGGYGDPLRRDPQTVAGDVRDEYVSRARARDIYAVALTDELTVDEAETTRLRQEQST